MPAAVPPPPPPSAPLAPPPPPPPPGSQPSGKTEGWTPPQPPNPKPATTDTTVNAPPPPPPQPTSFLPQKTSSRSKQLGVIVALTAIIALGGFWFYKHRAHISNSSGNQQPIEEQSSHQAPTVASSPPTTPSEPKSDLTDIPITAPTNAPAKENIDPAMTNIPVIRKNDAPNGALAAAFDSLDAFSKYCTTALAADNDRIENIQNISAKLKLRSLSQNINMKIGELISHQRQYLVSLTPGAAADASLEQSVLSLSAARDSATNALTRFDVQIYNAALLQR
jgi:hypothetical protein